MSGVSVDSVPQNNQTSSRARGGREAAPASNDQFAQFVDDEAVTTPRQDTRTASPPAQTNTRNAAPASQGQDAPATDAIQTTAPSPTPTNASLPQDKPAIAVATPVVPDEPTDVESEPQVTDAVPVPVAVFIGLQASVGTQADTTIESSEAAPVANPPAALPGQTAALALARVAQDTTTDATPKPAATTVTNDVTATDGDHSPQTPLPVPAVVAPDQTVANAALETATDLTTRIPVQAIQVEANAELQATIAPPTDDAAEHGRLIATAITQPSLVPLKPAASSEAPARTPSDNLDGAKPAPETKTTDTSPSTARHAATQTSGGADNSPVALQANDKPATSHSQVASDTSALPDPTPGALPTQTQIHAATTAPQLTATAANPNVAVPVAAIAVEIAASAQIGRSRFEIRLDPPELGRIEVKLDVDRQGQVTSHIIVEKAATLDLLRRDAPQLERALQDAGLKTSDNGLQFSLRDQQSQTGRQNADDNRRHAQHLMITEDETAPREVASRGYGRMLGTSGGIDMRV